jgi:5-methylcytosine-specific restriction endonuclease McrA
MMASNRKSKIKLIGIYGAICFLDGIILVKNPLTVHHIIPQRKKVDNRLSNLALLCHVEHQMFNAIERDNQRHAEDLNDGFREYKKTKNGLIIVQMRKFVDERINALGYEVENKGKLLTLRRQ